MNQQNIQKKAVIAWWMSFFIPVAGFGIALIGAQPDPGGFLGLLFISMAVVNLFFVIPAWPFKGHRMSHKDGFVTSIVSILLILSWGVFAAISH